MIVAVDFDGVLCKNEFPNIGCPNFEVVALIKELIRKGHEVVLWTSRNGEELARAVQWCSAKELYFHAINAPAPSNQAAYRDKYPVESRKVYADVYIDDHNLECICCGEDPAEHIAKCLRRILENEQR